MKKKLLLILSLSIITNLIIAQNDYQILLKSGKFTPKEITTVEEIQITSFEKSNNTIYRLVQFYDIPTKQEKEKIKQLGIVLKEYIPNNAYISKIPKSINLSNLKNNGIRSIYKLNANQKIDPSLKKEKLPQWAVNGKKISLLITPYSIEDKSIITNHVQSSNGEILPYFETPNTIKVNIDIEQIEELANFSLIQYIEPKSAPAQKEDTEGRSLHRSNTINRDQGLGRQYDGTGVVIGLADDGEIGPHIDFEGRLTQDGSPNNGTHGDMTSGILCGAGNLNPSIKGMAPGAYLYYYDIGGYVHVSNAVTNLSSFGTVLTSTSYSESSMGVYSSTARSIDEQINENTELMHIFSAGNAGTEDHSYGAGSGWANITGGRKAGKNVIACGNLNDKDVLENSSSRGPAADGRIKPDICSNGIGQLSTDENNTYQVGGGTSAAAPGVAGITTQLYHAYKENNAGANPDGGLIKACMLNSAEDLGNPGPDFKHGWGRVNALKAARIIEDHRYFVDSITHSANNQYTVAIPANVAQVRIMTYWSDVEGSTSASIALVNDINMTVTDPGSTTYNPWVLDPTPNASNLDANAVRGIDNLNNMEQVTIDNPIAGNYTVDLTGFSIPQGPQKLFVVYEFIYDNIELTYPIGGESLLPNTTEVIRWDAFGNTGDFTLEYSATGGASWTVINSSVSGSNRYLNWTVPNFQTGNCRVRVSRAGNSSSSTENFTICRAPNNLQVSSVCPDTITIQWSSLSGITEYEVSMLGDKYMDSIGTTSGNSFRIAGLNANDAHWFSVRATGNGIEGERAIAVEQTPGVSGCILNHNLAILEVLSPQSGELPNCLDFTNTEITVEIENIGGSSETNFDINYQINGGTIVTETYSSTLNPGANIEYTFSTKADLSAANGYSIDIWTSLATDLDNSDDLINAQLTIYNAQTMTFPSTENWDNTPSCNTTSNCGVEICDLGGNWKNSSNGTFDDLDWRVDEDGTPSNNTGPLTDFNLGTSAGKYVYLEIAAAACTEKEALLTSPCIDLTSATSAQFNFAYHMYGLNVGELHFDVVSNSEVKENIRPAKSGDKGSEWNYDRIDLDNYLGQVIAFRFRGITGNGPYGDIALDALGVSELSGISDDLSDSRISIVPNPNNGEFSIQFDKEITSTIQNITITNVLGELVYNNQFETNISNINIDLNNKANGIYYLTVNTTSGTITKKIIKK